jgi:hypothetical protein
VSRDSMNGWPSRATSIVSSRGHTPPCGCRACAEAGVSPSRLGAAILDYAFALRGWSRWLGGREKRRFRALGRYGEINTLLVRRRALITKARALPDGVTTGEAARRLGYTVRGVGALLRAAGFAGEVRNSGRGLTRVWRRP